MAASLQIAPGRLTVDSLDSLFQMLTGRKMTAEEREAAARRLEARKNFDPNQPRDDGGRWTDGGGGGGSAGSSSDSGGSSSPSGGSTGESSGSESSTTDDDLTSPKLFKPDELSLPEKAPQKAKTKDELYSQAKVEKETFDKGLNTGQGVDKALGANVARPNTAAEFNAAIESAGPTVIIAGLKGEERAVEKVTNKYGGDWSKLTDVIRATVAVESKGEIAPAVEAIRKEMADHGWSLAAKPDNRIENPTGAGYRDLNLLFRSANGHVAEVQVNTKSMIRAKQGDGHKLYEEYRSLEEPIKFGGREPTADESKRLTELSAQMSELYKTAWEA